MFPGFGGVGMVFNQEAEHESQWAAICSISDKLGMTSETLRRWVRQVETDEGRRAGLTTDEREQLNELAQENRDLQRANEILKSAAAFSGGAPRSVIPRAPTRVWVSTSAEEESPNASHAR